MVGLRAAQVFDEPGAKLQSMPASRNQTMSGEWLAMISDVNDLTVNYEEDGVLLVKELDKKILSKGAWSTLIFRYQDWDKAKGDYGPDRFTIRRYQKRSGEYVQKSKFNISSKDQAQSLIEALQGWIAG